MRHTRTKPGRPGQGERRRATNARTRAASKERRRKDTAERTPCTHINHTQGEHTQRTPGSGPQRPGAGRHSRGAEHTSRIRHAREIPDTWQGRPGQGDRRTTNAMRGAAHREHTNSIKVTQTTPLQARHTHNRSTNTHRQSTRGTRRARRWEGAARPRARWSPPRRPTHGRLNS